MNLPPIIGSLTWRRIIYYCDGHVALFCVDKWRDTTPQTAENTAIQLAAAMVDGGGATHTVCSLVGGAAMQ